MTVTTVDRVEPPATPAAATATPRRLDVQGLRAIAVLMVVAGHAGLPTPGGFVGVDVFFVISGFVITAMLQREWLDTGRIRFTRFFVRRFKRLAPPLAAMLVATIVASALFLSSGPALTIQTAVGSLAMTANLVIAGSAGGYFDAPARLNPLLHTWSLSIEEQFYLVFPILLGIAWWLARRARGGRNWPGILVTAVAIASLAMTFDVGGLGSSAGLSFWFGYYSPLTRAWEFAAGALIVLCPVHFVPGRRFRVALSFLGASALTASVWLITGATPFPGPWTLLPVAGTLLLLITGSHDDGPMARLLSSRPLVMLGDWSYSLYLWHWPFIVVAAAVWPGSPTAVLIAATLSIVPAAASHRWIEQPLRRLSTISLRQLILLVPATLIPPLVIAGAAGFAADHTFWSAQAAASLQAAEQKHLGELRGCFAEGPPTHGPADCTFGTGVNGPPVYLLGDSSADQFTEALVGATGSLGRSLTSYTSSGCTLADVTVTHADGAVWMPGCEAYKAETMAWLTSAPAGIVVLSNTDHYVIDPEFALSSHGSAPTTSTAEKIGLYSTALRHKIEAIQALGHKVVLIRTVPNFQPYVNGFAIAGWREPRHCPALPAWTGTCMSTETAPLADFARRQGVFWEMLTHVAGDTNSPILNLNDSICPGGECRVWQGDRLVYRDAKHLSVRESAELAPEFTTGLERLGHA